MHRYLVKIRYNGKSYYGISPQPNKRTILSDIFSKLGKPIRYRICSRTDKGVSAYENYIYLEYDRKVDFPNRINKYIKILEVKELERYIKFRDIVLEKTYIYIWKIDKPVYKPKYLVHNGKKMLISKNMESFNVNRILKNLKYFEGLKSYHNFSKEYKDPYCYLKSIFVKRVKDLIYFEFIGNRFLYQMIRRLVSFLISLGYGIINENFLEYIFLPEYLLEPKPPPVDPKNLILYKIKLKI